MTDQLGRRFIYDDIICGQPIVIPFGALLVKIVSRQGYTGSENNYEPIRLAVEPFDYMEGDARRYNAEVVIDGPFAEMMLVSESSVTSSILVHYWRSLNLLSAARCLQGKSLV